MNKDEMLKQAVVHFECEDYLDVEILCKKILMHDPSNSFANGLLGRLAVKFGEYTKAIDFFKKYIEEVNIEQREDSFLLAIADLYAALGNCSEAEGLYHKALTLSTSPELVEKEYLDKFTTFNTKNNFKNSYIGKKKLFTENHVFPAVLSDNELIWAPSTLDNILFQMSTKCNLRCVYCAQHWAIDHGHDANEITIKSILDFIQETGIKQITLNAYGETLVYKHWTKYAKALLENGVSIFILTNLSMDLTDEEYTLLSKFCDIAVSIDTADRRLFKEIRTHGRLETVLFNINKIRIAALKDGRQPPNIRWACALTDKIIPQLEDLVYLAKINNINTIGMNDLWYLDGRDLPVNSIFSLQGDTFFKSVESFNRAMSVARDANIEMSFFFLDGEKALSRKMTIEKAKLENNVEIDIVEKPFELHTHVLSKNRSVELFGQGIEPLKKGYTRLCLAPWFYPCIYPNGDVYACCIGIQAENPLGQVTSECSVATVMNNSKFVDLRHQLITGNITDPLCKKCILAPIVPVETLKSRVRQKMYENNRDALDLKTKEGLLEFIKALCPEQVFLKEKSSLEELTLFLIDYCAKQVLNGNVIETPEYDYFHPLIRAKILELCEGHPVYIWGMGGRYQESKKRLKGLVVKAFFDNSCDLYGSKTENGIPIMNPIELSTMPNYPIFVCSSAVDEITAEIKLLAPESVIVGFERRNYNGVDY